MKKIYLFFCLLLIVFSSSAQFCNSGGSSQITISGNRLSGFKATTLYSNSTFGLGDTTYREVMSSAWTCNSIPCYSRTLFRFDVSAIPPDAVVNSAKLYLYAKKDNNVNGLLGSPTYGSNNASLLQKVTSAWTLENSTWSNQPSVSTADQKILAQSTNVAQNYIADVTDFAQSWVRVPSDNYGMFLRLQAETYYNSMIFNSGQAADSLQPKLVISYSLPVGDQLIISGSGTSGLFKSTTIYSNSGFVLGDTTYREVMSSAWTCNTTPCYARTLFKFDISAIPTDATVNSAKLYLYAKKDNTLNGLSGSPTYGSNNTSLLQKITSPWSYSTASWNNQPSVSTTDQKTLPQSTSVTQDYVADITDFAQSWVSVPSDNHGMFLRLQTEAYYNSMIFNSGQAVDSLKPRLVICYSRNLPITLLNFQGNVFDKNAKLWWTTQNEINAASIQIERSFNGSEFRPLTLIKAKNLTSVNEYTYTDHDLVNAPSKIIYRLKLIDKDGSYKYSKTIRLALKNSSENVIISPNPADKYARLSFSSEKQETTSMLVLDAMGKTALSQIIRINKGMNSYKIEGLEKLAKGIYVVRFVLNNEWITKQLIIN